MLRSLPTAALACLLACVLLTPVGEAAAAGIHSTATASQRVTFRNQTGIQLLLATTTPYDFGPISPLAAANPAGNENRATVWSNGTWRLQVRAAGPDFVQSPTGTGTIPVARLRLAGTTAILLSTTDR